MFISSVDYLKKGEDIKIVVQTGKSCFDAELSVGDKVFKDSFNDEEPYDRKTHVFFVPEILLENPDAMCFSAKRYKVLKRKYRISYNPVFADENELMKQYDSQIEIQTSERETVADGVTYSHFDCKDKCGDPVHIFMIEVDPQKASLYTGTPNDGYESVNVKAKVPEMIEAAVNNGVNVVAAVNADFFDMFGDCHPSGLCVKNSKIIANAQSKRPFIGIKKDGTPVITDIAENENITSELIHAAAGLEMIVRDGKCYEWGPLEPFSFVRHPRTAAGIKKDGTVILLEVDGRIPEYSNGATLVDLAKFMIEQGADRAINLDGGGSSIVYTKGKDGFVLRNNPADLIRPRAKLIRKEFDALLVVSQ